MQLGVLWTVSNEVLSSEYLRLNRISSKSESPINVQKRAYYLPTLRVPGIRSKKGYSTIPFYSKVYRFTPNDHYSFIIRFHPL